MNHTFTAQRRETHMAREKNWLAWSKDASLPTRSSPFQQPRTLLSPGISLGNSQTRATFMPELPPPSDSLRLLRFRIAHTCPLARFSRDIPDQRFTVWSGHDVAVLQVMCSRGEWPGIVEGARSQMRLHRSFQSADGGLLVASIDVTPDDSISRTLEAHHCLWMQPVVLEGGWEHYESIVYGATSDQRILGALRRHGSCQLLKRRPVEARELAQSLFFNGNPIVNGPTDKQVEALIAAGDGGYYQKPRRTTTRELAGQLALGRSSFEERLRSGENRIMAALLPAFKARR